MKFLMRLINVIPDQTASTFLLLGMTYVFGRGIIACWNEPPRMIWLWIGLFIGVGLGILNVFRLEAIENENKKDATDRDN